MKLPVLSALILLSTPLCGESISVTIQTPEGDSLPASRVSLIELSESAQDCRVVDQDVADQSGRASFDIDTPGVYMVAGELAGFIGAEVGPFRIEEESVSAAIPYSFTILLHASCCLDDPVVNGYLLARRCGGSSLANTSEDLDRAWPSNPSMNRTPSSSVEPNSVELGSP